MTEDQIKHMVNRFLMWRLPEDFRPDAGISFKPDYNEDTPWPMKHEPVGTNLFDATQTDAMVRYMIEGLPAAPPKSLAEKVREAAKRPVPDDTMPQRPAKADAILATDGREIAAGRLDPQKANPMTPSEGPDELLLKWGTMKGWHLQTEGARAAAKRYLEAGPQSLGAMSQHDTADQKAELCALIDAIDGRIINDWTGQTLTKEEARRYVLEYRP